MRLEIINRAVVLLAKGEQPLAITSTLHHAWLLSQGIVPKTWQPQGNPVCTPGFSVAQYDNGIALILQGNRLQVSQEQPDSDIGKCPVAEVASKLVDSLAQVEYEAVGANMDGFIECQGADTLLVEQFLKEGPWTSPKPTAAAVTLVYPVDEAVLRLTLDPGSVSTAQGDQRSGIIVKGNYHTDLAGPNKPSNVKTALMSFRKHDEHFRKTVHLVFGLRG